MAKKEVIRPPIDAAPVETPSPAISGLETLLPVLLGTATLLGFCLHLIGHVDDVTYLADMGMQPDLVPQTAESKIILGYGAIITQGANLLLAPPIGVTTSIFVAVTIATLVSQVAGKREPPFKAWFNRRKRWIQSLISSSFASLFGMIMVAAFGVALLVVGIVPASVGVSSGKERAKKMGERIAAKAPEHRSELWRGEKREARGYIISINDERIAIYDIDIDALRVFPRDGLEVRSALRKVAPSGSGGAAPP
ncbi:MAG: hypothetical protein J0M19_00010 [Sphingomonadales bacterium]|nr:hypothetical protein [Sphingomonadales bacterium]